MTRQFTPADRETVMDVLSGQSHIEDVEPCGDGVYVIYRCNSNSVRMYTALTEESGWYVSSYDVRDGGDRVILMPITEVPE